MKIELLFLLRSHLELGAREQCTTALHAAGFENHNDGELPFQSLKNRRNLESSAQIELWFSALVNRYISCSVEIT